jgi:hypothetical protein
MGALLRAGGRGQGCVLSLSAPRIQKPASLSVATRADESVNIRSRIAVLDIGMFFFYKKRTESLGKGGGWDERLYGRNSDRRIRIPGNELV